MFSRSCSWVKSKIVLFLPNLALMFCFTFLYTTVVLYDWINFAYLGFSNLLDIYLRINISDSILNTFNLLWTNLTYLMPFFWGLFSLFLVNYYFIYTAKLTYLLILGLTFFLAEFVDMALSSGSLQTLTKSDVDINLLLLNNLNKYHPFLLYWGVATTLIIAFNLTNRLIRTYPFALSSTFYMYRLNLYLLNLVVIIALFLGSWWALQEGTWGGWWNWDPSEVLGLLIMLLATSLFHKGTEVNSALINIFPRYIYYLQIMVFAYTFLQLNFELTSHSFGARFTSFYSTNLFYLELLAVLSLTLGFCNVLNYRFSTVFISILYTGSLNRIVQTTHYFLLNFIYWLVASVLLFSFTPLVNYFMWRYFALNLFNNYLSLDMLLWNLFILYTVRQKTLNKSTYGLLLILLLFTPSTLPLIFIVLLSSQLTRTYWLHWTLMGMVYTNTMNSPFQLAYWFSYSLFEDLSLPIVINAFSSQPSCIDNYFQDILVQSLVGCQTYISNYNTFYKVSKEALLTTSLYTDDQIFGTSFQITNVWYTTSIYIESVNLNVLLELVIISSIFTFSLLLKGYRAILY